jgi:hypothetical protein
MLIPNNSVSQSTNKNFDFSSNANEFLSIIYYKRAHTRGTIESNLH